MNTYTALKEVIPWAQPAYEDKVKAKRLARLTKLYFDNDNKVIKKIIERMITELEGGQN